MSMEINSYKCVHCGEPADALYKRYGPSVLKLTKCKVCGNVVDKYVEYDPVIVMIDLVLMSREAQTHVIYNTEFKDYWKVFIILMMLETYGMWRSHSLTHFVVQKLCGLPRASYSNSSYHEGSSVQREWCDAWARREHPDTADLFIWEKNFYIHFLSVAVGIAAFILSTHIMARLMSVFTKTNEGLVVLLKAFSLGNISVVLTVPALVWGGTDTDTAAATHHALVLLYGLVLFYNLFKVVYGAATVAGTGALVLGGGSARLLATPPALLALHTLAM